VTRTEWIEKGKKLFGDDMMKWPFVCPSCGHVATAQDYKDAGAPSTVVAFSCIGRWMKDSKEAFGKDGGPCNYAGGGLIGLNPIEVDEEHYFDFAKQEPKDGGGE